MSVRSPVKMPPMTPKIVVGCGRRRSLAPRALVLLGWVLMASACSDLGDSGQKAPDQVGSADGSDSSTADAAGSGGNVGQGGPQCAMPPLDALGDVPPSTPVMVGKPEGIITTPPAKSRPFLAKAGNAQDALISDYS